MGWLGSTSGTARPQMQPYSGISHLKRMVLKPKIVQMSRLWPHNARAAQIGWSLGTNKPRTPVNPNVVKLKFDKLGGIDAKGLRSTFNSVRFTILFMSIGNSLKLVLATSRLTSFC